MISQVSLFFNGEEIPVQIINCSLVHFTSKLHKVFNVVIRISMEVFLSEFTSWFCFNFYSPQLYCLVLSLHAFSNVIGASNLEFMSHKKSSKPCVSS